MNVLKICFLLPLSIFCQNLSAQIDDLLKDKNITWAIETYNDFMLDPSFENKLGWQLNRIAPLKFVNEKGESIESRFALQKLVTEAAIKGDLPVFYDDQCTQTLPKQFVAGADSITQIDPVTFKQKVLVVENKQFSYERILVFRVRQIVFYNAKKAQFGLKTLAIAPIIKGGIKDSMTEQNSYPMFWFRPKDINKSLSLSNKAIIWASQMNLHNGILLRGDKIKILKGKVGETMVENLFKAFETQVQIPFYATNKEGNPNFKMSMASRKALLAVYRDTSNACNENPPRMIITERQTKPKDVERLQLRQNWYWNKRKNNLEIHLISVAPLKDVKNEADELLYRYPLFYRRNDETKPKILKGVIFN